MKHAGIGILVFVGLLGSGCHQVTYATQRPTSSAAHQKKASFFLWGLVGQENVDLASICPQGVSRFQNRIDFGDGIVGCLTCGLYQPVTIEVHCTHGGVFRAVPDPEQNVTWIYEVEPTGALDAPEAS